MIIYGHICCDCVVLFQTNCLNSYILYLKSYQNPLYKDNFRCVIKRSKPKSEVSLINLIRRKVHLLPVTLKSICNLRFKNRPGTMNYSHESVSTLKLPQSLNDNHQKSLHTQHTI